MKKYIVLLFGLLLFLMPFSNVFANDELDSLNSGHGVGLLYDPNDNAVDGDDSTARSISGSTVVTYEIEPSDITHYYLKTSNGRVAVRLVDGAGNEIKTFSDNGYRAFNPKIEDVHKVQIYNGGNLTYAAYSLEIYGHEAGLDVEPPEEVGNLTAEEDNETVTLNWSNPNDEDFSGIQIYQDNTLIKENLTGTSFTINDLENFTEYTFKITTVDTTGNESNGKTITATPYEWIDSDGDGIPGHEDEYPDDPLNGQPDSDGDGIPDSEDEYPDDPENIPPPETAEEVPEVESLEIEATPERVDLSWNNPPKYFGKATIYRKTTGTVTSFNINDLNPFAAQTVYAAEDYEPLFETNGTTFADLSVNENEEYEYKVTNTYNGIESNGVTVQTTIPEPPLVDTSEMTLPFGVEGLIESGNGLLLLIGGFVLLALAFIFVPKVIAAIRQSFSGSNGAAQTAAPGTRLTERQQKIVTGQKQREPRAPRIPREPRQGRT